MDDTFRQAMLDSNWSSICRRAEIHVEGMSTGWSPEAYELLSRKLSEFVSQPSPHNNEELQRRFSQSMGLTAIVSSVSHIEMMLGKYSNRSDDRLRLIKVACDLHLDRNVYASTMALTTQVSTICFQELSLARRR